MWAMRRRLLIIGIIFGAVFILVIFPYWLKHREVPTCFDGKQNQGEMGIDCGAPCALICKGVAKDLKILWTKVFPIREGEYDVVAYVENPNFDVGASKFSYVASLYDANDVKITEIKKESFALPNERFVLFAGGILTGEKQAVRGSIEIDTNFPWVTTITSPTLFTVKDKVLAGADDRPRLNAILENLTFDEHRNIEVGAVIYDSKNNPIGVSATRVQSIAPKDQEKLIFTWPHGFTYTAENEECETPVDVILAIDRSGSMREEDKIGQARSAAISFVDKLSTQDQGGYVSFASDASNPMDQFLTNDIVRLKRVIEKDDIRTTGGLQFTNIGDAIVRSINEFTTQRHNKDARPIVVLLTDGIPNRPLNPEGKGSQEYASQYALQVAESAKSNGISLYTIGLGSDVNNVLLEGIASTPQQYYQAASGAELDGVYKQIATSMCKKNPSIIEIIPRLNNVTPIPQAR